MKQVGLDPNLSTTRPITIEPKISPKPRATIADIASSNYSA